MDESSGDNTGLSKGISFTPSAASGFSEKGSKKGLLLLAGLVVVGGIGGGYFYLTGTGDDIARPVIAAAAPPAVPVEQPAPSVSLTELTQPAAGDPAPTSTVGGAMIQSAEAVAQAATPKDTADQAPAVPSASGAVTTAQPAAATPVVPVAPAASDAAIPAAPTKDAGGVTMLGAPETVSVAEEPKAEALTTPQTNPVNPPAEAPAAATAPAPAPAATPGAPAPAELAIVQNAAVLDTMSPPGSALKGSAVTDLLAQPADIRALPEKYLVVKQDHAANDTDARLTAARSALSQGSYQAAFELFDDLYEKNPQDKRALLGRAVALQKMGDKDAAVAAYELVLRHDPKNLEALTNMLGLLKVQDSDTAIEKLLKLRESYPANAPVSAQLGMMYGVAGDYGKALKYLEMADALKPGDPNILYNRAVVYDRMGNGVQAASLYRQIVLMAGDGSLDQNFPLDAVKKRLAVIH